MYMLPPPLRMVVLLLGLEAADYWGTSPLGDVTCENRRGER